MVGTGASPPPPHAPAVAAAAGAPPPPASSSSSSWRTPSEANQIKYNLVPLPETFQLTREEEDLLAAYETVRFYEKEAVRLKEEAARAKLAAKDAEFKQQQQQLQQQQQQQNVNTTTDGTGTKRSRKKKSKRGGDHQKNQPGPTQDGEDQDMNDDESSVEEDEDDDDDDDRAKQVDAKLAAMREKMETSKQNTALAQEEALRAQLLAKNVMDDEDDTPLLKRKKLEPSTEPASSSSLIANLNATSTPPHDFSQTLGIKPWNGKVLFPNTTASLPDHQSITMWTPPSSATNFIEGALTLELEEFDVTQAQHGSGNNTCAIKFHAPSDSKRFRYVYIFEVLLVL
jgi:hypothetical protein